MLVANLLFTRWIPEFYGASHTLQLLGMSAPLVTEVGKLTAIWAVEAALLLASPRYWRQCFGTLRGKLAEGHARRSVVRCWRR